MNSKFQEWLRQYITENAISNAECAKRFGVHESLITYYLKGSRQPTYATLQKIKFATKADLNTMFLDEAPETSQES